jgi:CheY-like chemotaxis protein
MKNIFDDAAVTTWTSSAPHTVLLVEDENIVRMVLEEMLLRLGYRVITAENGQQAWDQFIQDPAQIDLVVFDMSMPGMSGDTLFKQLKSVAPELKTVLTSGYSDDAPLDEMRSSGLTAVLPKPFNMQQVREKMRELFPENAV